LGGQPQPELNQIGQALITLTLEMMLGRPEGVIAELVHLPRHIAGRPEYLAEPFVRIPAVVGRRALQADVVQFNLTDIECMKSFDHSVASPPQLESRPAAFPHNGVRNLERDCLHRKTPGPDGPHAYG